ncbi:hypothetical protein SBOR_7807 [Sclerotinia borealis F-4128]|uniref:Piwi domain-containing protein n=1 Tax=Sclerotinia borealis (strain F-4128) TaxID=1432307 RepID=W9C501_SCLBF|nr:hypothetical protein SBOR_7807 [Sclerotinia borealis F-4128]
MAPPKGCSNCGSAQNHKISVCKNPYPPYDRQVCDECLEYGHEFQNSPSRMGEPWKSCGHAPCKKKNCQVLGDKKYSEISQDIADQFTPIAREAWLRKREEASTAPTVGESSASSTTPAPIATSGTSSSTAGPSQLPAAAEVDDRTEEERLQQLYDGEAKNMPRAVPSQNWDSPTMIHANFYKITIGGTAQICKYSICLDTIIPRGKTEAEAILLEANKGSFKTISWATDYKSLVVTNKPLKGHNLNAIDHLIPTPHTRSGSDGNPINMSSSLKYLGLVNTQALKDHVTSNGPHLDHPEEELKFLNIISWKKINSPGYAGGRVGKKFYPQSFVADIERMMSYKRGKRASGFRDSDVPLYQIRRGFFSSIRPGKGSILLNINLATSAFFSPINLARWIKSNEAAESDFRRALKGVHVIFDLHSEGRQKFFTIRSINSLSVSGTKFTKNDGNEIYVHSYMTVTFPKGRFEKDAYCVNVESNARPTWYPADHLKIVEWQIVKKNLPEPYVAAIIDTTQGAKASKKCIKESALPELDIVESGSFYKEFGITPSTTLVEINAGKLEITEVQYPGVDINRAAGGSWSFKYKKCCQPGNAYTTLHVLWLRSADDPAHNQAYMEDLTNTLVSSLQAFGLSQITKRFFSQAQVPSHIQHTAPEAYRQACTDSFNEALPGMGGRQNVSLILVVLPERSRKLYPEVKRWGDCDVGIPKICVVEETLGKRDLAICGNISLKFNLKLKGINQKVNQKCGLKPQTMVVGADVTHPGDEEERPSIAAVVATNDEESFQYLGSARLQEGKQEYISDLRGMMKERLLAWAEKASKGPVGLGGRVSQVVPDQILFYRDGVSESQFGMVRHHEKQQILDGCIDAYNQLSLDTKNKRPGALPKLAKGVKWKPGLTLIVAIKRHHARFYPWSEDTANDAISKKNDPNLNAGTIVDSVVVTPNHLSFYLQSHCSPLGTARSTQRINYATPARYADLLCDRLRCYLKPVLEGYRDTRVTNDMDGAQRATVYEGNTVVWKPNTGVALPEGWRNPWNSLVKDIMFYL